MSPRSLALLTGALALFACSSEDPGPDAGASDAALDGGTPDTGAIDAGADPVDAGQADAAAPDGGEIDAGGPPPPLDCSETTLRAIPTDTSTTGPWPVGVRTATVAGLRVEIWYPAVPGAEAGRDRARYDVRGYLPASEQGKIPDDDAPTLGCDCYRDVPLDDGFGPYPPIVFVHGTAGFRYQSLAQMTHWASRGFVVLAADHPGLNLADLLGLACGGGLVDQDLEADLDVLVGALDAPAGDLSFLAGAIDPARLGMAGHSAGGGAIRAQGDRAAVLIPMASRGVDPGAELRSTLVLAADRDQVVDFEDTEAGYAASPRPKRFVALANAGHLAFSNLCSLENADGQNLVEVADEHDVCGVALAGRLFDCNEAYLPDPEGWRIVDDATTAAFEETLQCRAEAGARFEGLDARYGDDVAEVIEEL